MKYTNIYIIIIILLLLLLFSLIYDNYNIEFYQNQEDNFPSFHVLLPTMGKDSMFNMLDNLKEQLNKNDYLTIVFDGPSLPNIENVRRITSNFKCKVNIIVEKKNLGFWGHAIRNKHNKLKGDYVFHVDDDDNITPDCMENLRNICKDKNTIYIFKMDNNGDMIWKTKELIPDQIGTPMGIVPTQINPTSEFTYNYGGDYEFYKKLEDNGNKLKYIDKLIYIVKK
jgi:hypothetical protein